MRILTILLLVSNLSFADTIAFRDGHTVRGSYLGGDARTVRVAIGDRVESYALSDISNISFEGGAPTSPYPQSSSAPPPPPYNPPREPVPPPVLRQAPDESRSVRRADERQIPTGSVLTIRMIDDVDSQRDDVGKTYRASLDEPVSDSAGNTLVPRGADVMVKLVDDKESGKIEGKTVLTLDIVSLNVNGRDIDVDTASITQESGSRTGRSAKVIGGTAVLGTIIGAIAGGGKGAAIGAVSGAGAGTAVQVLTKGQRVRIPSETRLTFTLQQTVRL